MKYINYLKNKNLSQNTIAVYQYVYLRWNQFIGDKNPTKTLFVSYIKQYSKTHQARSTRLHYAAIISIFKFEKRWKLINNCKDIKLPQIEYASRTVLTFEEFDAIKDKVPIDNNWITKRNWIIYTILFQTGIRISEINQFNKKNIQGNILFIKGKGNKTRKIYISEYLQILLKTWKSNKVAITKNNKNLSTKQMNKIIKKMSLILFDKYLTPHDLRRSFATTLVKSQTDLEIVRKVMGHSNINTTIRYTQYNDDDIFHQIKRIFNNN